MRWPCCRDQRHQDAASKMNWARGTKAGREEGLRSGNRCLRDRDTPHPKGSREKTWGHTRFRDECYLPKQNVGFFVSFTTHPSWFLSSLGNCGRTVARWERLVGSVRGREVLRGLCSEIMALRAPSKGTVSLTCPGTRRGSREFNHRPGQTLPVAGQWACERT